MDWNWEVRGMEIPSSPGSGARGIEQSGTYTCELMGEVASWLAERGEFWELLDDDYPLTITITPAAVPDDDRTHQEET